MQFEANVALEVLFLTAAYCAYFCPTKIACERIEDY